MRVSVPACVCVWKRLRHSDRMCVLNHLFSLSVAVYIYAFSAGEGKTCLLAFKTFYKSPVKNVVHNLHTKFSHCLITPGFMYFFSSDVCLCLFQRNMVLFVIANWMR